MRLTYSPNLCIIVLRENSKIHDQNITYLKILTQNFFKKKNKQKLEEKYSCNPSENTFIF